MMMRRSLLLVLVATACTNTPTTSAVLAIPGAAPADATFYDLPYPNDHCGATPTARSTSRSFPSNSPLLRL